MAQDIVTGEHRQQDPDRPRRAAKTGELKPPDERRRLHPRHVPDNGNTCVVIQTSMIEPAARALTRPSGDPASTKTAAVRNEPPTTVIKIKLGTK